MAFEGTVTTSSDLLIPQVLAPMIEQKYTDKQKFTPIAIVDTTLQAQAGKTIDLPYYTYIGDAEDVGEGEDIPVGTLSQDKKQVTVSKFGKGVILTDEDMLYPYGNAMEESLNQIALAMANKQDNEVLNVLDSDIPDSMTVEYESDVDISSDLFADALLKYGEDEEGEKIAFVSPKMMNTLRKSEDWIPVTEIGVQVLMSGVMGMIWGCQIRPSNKITNKFFIVKPGAIKIYLKRGVMFEADRNIQNQTNLVVASKIAVVYLYDESKAISVNHVVKATLTVEEVEIADNETEDASVDVDPDDATVDYEVEDTDVATVDSTGEVSGVAEGETTLIVTIEHDDYATRTIEIPITITAS
ncbi:MAG: N4-gp56 family major capsid protein [archaeon]